MRMRHHFTFFITVFIIVVLLGTYFYQFIEGWNFVDSLYFVVVSITTIGYGDLYPVTNAGKLFTILFSFIGIAMAFYAVSLISTYVFKKHIDTKVRQLKEKIEEEQETKDKKKKK